MQSGVILLEADAEFVARMEYGLASYERPYDERQRMLCMDEQTLQLVMEAYSPVTATKLHPCRVDDNWHSTPSDCWLTSGTHQRDQGGRLGNQVADDLAADIRQTKLTPLVGIGELRVVYSKLVQQCGVQIVNVNRLGDDVVTEVVGLTVS